MAEVALLKCATQQFRRATFLLQVGNLLSHNTQFLTSLRPQLECFVNVLMVMRYKLLPCLLTKFWKHCFLSSAHTSLQYKIKGLIPLHSLTENSKSREADSRQFSKKSSYLLWNANMVYRVHNERWIRPFPRRIFFNIHPNIILKSTARAGCCEEGNGLPGCIKGG